MHSRYWILLAASLLCAGSASAQPRPVDAATFPKAAFDSADRIAYYLWQYDSFAWASTEKLSGELQSLGKDAVDRLGAEWFCFQQGSVWHAVYGKFDEATDRYDVVAHYTSTDRGIVRSQVPVNALADRFGRALFLTMKRIPGAFHRSGIRFNSFVREREDGAIDVWFVPAWQSNGWILYGSEFQYTLDAAGRNVRDSVVRLGDIKGTRPDSSATVNLVHPNPGIPTVAQILFMRLYTKRFAHVRVFTRDWVTELLDVNGQQAWVSALREK